VNFNPELGGAQADATGAAAASTNAGGPVVLSICIATFRRAAFIAQTLDSIVAQLRPDVELLVLDGASPDETPRIMEAYVQRHPNVVYRREPANSGFDADFDKVVGYARGEFCWLMTDDDLLAPGAVARVLAELRADRDLVIVNAEVRNQDFSVRLQERMLPAERDSEWAPRESERFFALSCQYLSFIGAVIIRRSLWLARERGAYYTSMFIHMGVIFQKPLDRTAHVIAEPLIVIRYGNAQWSARSFEIWMSLWPRLIWSFEQFSEEARRRITLRHPAESLKRLLWFRAIGAFGTREYEQLLRSAPSPRARRMARLVLGIPDGLANTAVALYCLPSFDRFVRLKLFELVRAPGSTALTRAIGVLRGVPRG
jgi:glycosyltransferase involved in cell wall biosynthesis